MPQTFAGSKMRGKRAVTNLARLTLSACLIFVLWAAGFLPDPLANWKAWAGIVLVAIIATMDLAGRLDEDQPPTSARASEGPDPPAAS
jgi:drug/metabolite transporter (DMT)-like permease